MKPVMVIKGHLFVEGLPGHELCHRHRVLQLRDSFTERQR